MLQGLATWLRCTTMAGSHVATSTYVILSQVEFGPAHDAAVQNGVLSSGAKVLPHGVQTHLHARIV